MAISNFYVDVLSFLFALLIAPSAAGPFPVLAEYRPPSHPGSLPDRYFVQLRANHSLDAHFERIGVDLSSRADFRYMDQINLYAVDLNYTQVHSVVRNDPGVEYVRHGVHAKTNLSNESYGVAEKQHIATKLSRRWKLQSQDLYHVLMVTKLFKGNIPKNLLLQVFEGAGKGVDVYVMDSGVELTHRTFRGKNVRNFRNQDHPPYVSPESADDDRGHGTSIASVALQVAPEISIVNVRIASATVGTTEELVLQAFNDIIHDHNQNKITPPPEWRGSVINLSQGLPFDDFDAFEKVFKSAFDSGIPIAVAAGNTGFVPLDPGCKWPELTTCVAGCTEQYNWDKYSEHGPNIAVIAPSENIRAAIKTAEDVAYGYVSGTSFATPIVVAIMAIYISWERISDDVAKVRDRMMQNALTDVIKFVPPYTANKLVQIGLYNRDKEKGVPYKGAPKDRAPEFAAAQEQDSSAANAN